MSCSPLFISVVASQASLLCSSRCSRNMVAGLLVNRPCRVCSPWHGGKPRRRQSPSRARSVRQVELASGSRCIKLKSRRMEAHIVVGESVVMGRRESKRRTSWPTNTARLRTRLATFVKVLDHFTGADTRC
ncbi:hypothetical protein BDZ89DRAFT_36902 [Hymenopellis radicata]|nr:hypothetical protein BDZ89DRAFT_36902 [Hymenopellis radicata]